MWSSTEAQGVRRAGDAGAGEAQARSFRRPDLRLPRAARLPAQGAVVGRPGAVPVREAAGEGPLRLAVAGGWQRRAHAGATWHAAGSIDWRMPVRTWRPDVAG